MSLRELAVRNLHENLAYTLKNGLQGADPLIYKKLPLNKLSEKYPSVISIFLRKAEKYIVSSNPKVLTKIFNLALQKENLNAYGLALFLQALLKMEKLGFDTPCLSRLVEVLLRNSLVELPNGKRGVGNPGVSGVIYLPGTSEAIITYINLYNRFQDAQYLEVATSLARGVMENVRFHKSDSGGFFSYGSEGPHSCILNANSMLLNGLVFIQTVSENNDLKSIALEIYNHLKQGLNYRYIPYKMERICKSEYDVYHTGFFLRSLSNAALIFNDITCIDSLKKSADNMLLDFVSDEGYVHTLLGRPRQYDIHGVAEYIRTVVHFSLTDKYDQVLRNNIKHMLNNNGTYFYQRGMFEIDIYMPRWGHFPMMLALSELALSLRD